MPPWPGAGAVSSAAPQCRPAPNAASTTAASVEMGPACAARHSDNAINIDAELVVPDQTGLLVEPGQTPSLTEAIEKLLSDPKRAQAMGLEGQNRAKTAFSWEKTAADYESLYGRLVTEADCGAPAERA